MIGINAVFSGVLFAQPVEITDFFNTANNCDYLIITPQAFSEGAFRLAKYRNGFIGDDVSSAKYIVLEKLLDQCPHPEQSPDTILRESITWALEKWCTTPSYIVLIGDDSVRNLPACSTYGSRGPMPTHISDRAIAPVLLDNNIYRYDTTYKFSDDWYLRSCSKALSTASPYCIECFEPPVALGRIPCEQAAEFDRYLQKIQRYESLPKAPWRNRVLLVADDTINGDSKDFLNHSFYLNSAKSLLPGRFLTSIYFNDFMAFGQAVYPVAAKESFFTEINRGAGWTFLFGHGSPSQFTNEKILIAEDCINFRNTDMPTMLFSVACANGGFYRTMKRSMCKRYLFAVDGGTIIYIANPNDTYYQYSFGIMKAFLHMRDSLPGLSVGTLIACAKRGTCFAPENSFEVLGDPAIHDGNAAAQSGIQLSGDNTLACTFQPSAINSGTLYWEITQSIERCDSLVDSLECRDSMLLSGKTTVVNGACRFVVPPLPKSNSLIITAYAWNDSFESRSSMRVFNGASSSPLQPMMSSFAVRINQRVKNSVLLGDSQLIGVVGNSKVVQWGRQPLGFSPGVTLPTSSPYRQIDALAPSVKEGNVIIAAVDSQRITTNSIRQVTIRKIDRWGKEKWSFCDSLVRVIHGIKDHSDGGCIVWGATNQKLMTNCIRINANGQPMWKKTIRTDIRDIAAISGDEWMFTGSRGDSVSNRNTLHFGVIDQTGEIRWEKIVTKGSTAAGNALCRLRNGRWIIAGTAEINKTSSMWILCASSDGDTLWSRTIENGFASSCLETDDGAIAVGGSLGNDGVVALFDREGNVRHTMNVPGCSVRLLAGEKSAYTFLVAIAAQDSSMESIGILSGSKTFINSQMAHKPMQHATQLNASFLPPSRVLLTIGTSQKTNTVVELFDLRGRRIQTVSVPSGANHVLLNLRTTAAGTYIARLRAGDIVSGGVRFHLP